METQIKQDVKSFLAGHFKNYELQDDEDIFSLGFVNSLFAIQLVNFVEQKYGLTIEDDDLDIANFRSLNAITALVQRQSKPALVG